MPSALAGRAETILGCKRETGGQRQGGFGDRNARVETRAISAYMYLLCCSSGRSKGRGREWEWKLGLGFRRGMWRAR